MTSRRSKVELHVNMPMLAYALTALSHLEADDYANMLVMEVRLLGAERRVEPASVENCPGCNLCPEHEGLAA